jgi:hypothetical protein
MISRAAQKILEGQKMRETSYRDCPFPDKGGRCRSSFGCPTRGYESCEKYLGHQASRRGGEKQ